MADEPNGSILGLPTLAKFGEFGDRPYSHRRQILHHYPQGGAALTGLLSLVNVEPVSDVRYYWYEKFWRTPGSTLRGAASLATPVWSGGTQAYSADGAASAATAASVATIGQVFTPAGGTAPAGDGVVTAGGAFDAASTGFGPANTRNTNVNNRNLFYISVDDVNQFKTWQVVEVAGLTPQFLVKETLAGTPDAVSGRVPGVLVVELLRPLLYTPGGVGTTNYFVNSSERWAVESPILVTGTAYVEGARDIVVRPTAYQRPFRIDNYTRIFRDAMDFTGSVLQAGLWFDKSGVYQEKAKQTVLEHMVGIERSILFGQRSTGLVSDNNAQLDTETGGTEKRTFSGILEFLRAWNAGSDGLPGAELDAANSTWAPYAFKRPSYNDDNDDCRILENADGIVNTEKFDVWAERISRYGNNMSKDKLVICGSGAIIAMHQLFRKNSHYVTKAGEKMYGLDFQTLITPFGNYHFLTHPLFNSNSQYRYWALFLDLSSIKLRPYRNRDTRLIKNAKVEVDLRRDEYLTELGLELWNPAGHMLVKNIKNYVG
jgi:hypothetical protein